MEAIKRREKRLLWFGRETRTKGNGGMKEGRRGFRTEVDGGKGRLQGSGDVEETER